ncbi:MAG: polysaccharide deacetylase family protein [Cyanobacteria bacterium P01_F01_bin.143]
MSNSNQVNSGNSGSKIPQILAIALGLLTIVIFAIKQGLIGSLGLILIILILLLIIFFRARWIIYLISPLICPDAIWELRPNKNRQKQKLVALTIDDGPDSLGSTQDMLEVLQDNGASATFFIIGKHLQENRAVVEKIVEQGHELGNHMATDAPTISLSDQDFAAQLGATHELLQEVAQESQKYPEITWFRPGSGFATSRMVEIANEKYNYRTALGFVWPFDTNISSPRFSERFILNNARDGSIIILHDRGENSERGDRTVEALKEVLPELTNRGYKVVTLSELLSERKPIKTWLRFGNFLDKLRQRIINSLLQLPKVNDWRWIFGIWLVFASIMLVMGFATNFIEFKLAPEFSLIFFLEQFSYIFFIPSVFEEIVFRAIFIPGIAERSNKQKDLQWGVISLLLYVFSHLPGGLAADFINGLKGRETTYFMTFIRPIFLIETTLLGFCCTIIYLTTRSIWPPVIFHWFVVVAWLLFLGGYELLNSIG